MEESVQKAFDGFELPVSDADWSRIAGALDAQTTKKRGAWWLWFKNNLGLSLLLIFITLSTSAGIIWQVNSGKEANTQVPQKDRINQNSGIGNAIQKTESASGGATQLNPINPNKQVENSVTTHPNRNNRADKNLDPVFSGTQPKPILADAIEVPVPSVITENPDVVNPEPVKPEPLAEKHKLVSFGLKALLGMLHLYKSEAYPLALIKHKAAVNPPEPLSMGYYSTFSTTFDPGKVSYAHQNGIWDGFNWISGSNPALDFRIEGGMELSNSKLAITLGGALEGNPLNTSSRDTIRIKIADKYFPYKDINGKVLYYLAIRWRDSIVVINRNTQHVWAELPVGIRKSFQTAGKFKFTAGLSLNPGILLGSKGSIANPYTSNSGSYWAYNHNIQADTTSAVIDAGQFLNPIRLGSGIQLGVEKESRNMVWGLNLQSRYYFTPVWKTGVPLKQNTFQYGINLKLGFKI